MKAIDNSLLVNSLNLPTPPAGFVPTVNYAINASVQTVTLTDASAFPTGDSFAKINAHAIDNLTGKRVPGAIAVAGGNVVITLTGSTMSNISITATVISANGLVADLGIYKITTAALTGTLGSVAEHAEPVNAVPSN